jgi:hypothetical protein
VDPASVEKGAAAAVFQAPVELDLNRAAPQQAAPRKSVQAASVAGRVPAPKTNDHPAAAAQPVVEPMERAAPRILKTA